MIIKRNYLLSILLTTAAITTLLFAWSCEKEDPVELPVLTTLSVTEITSTSAKSGGNITDSGGADITSRGLVWGTTNSPTLEQHLGITTDGSGTGLFTSNLSNLTSNTTYYVRSYAINSAGTAYGNEVQFTTQGEKATLTTANVTDISATSAISGGNIADDGGASVTARGVVWSTSQNPTLENNLGSTNNGSGTGSFTSNLTGLTANTTYYVRAYATNSVGTGYGEQRQFITRNPIVYFTVYDCSNWSPDKFREPQSNAIIKIYTNPDDVGTEDTYDVLTTDLNGQAILYGSRENSYAFTVEMGNKSNIINGYLLIGTYNSQEDIDNHSYDPNAEIGGLKFQDTNDDGLINEHDKVNYDWIGRWVFLTNDSISKDVYIAE